MKKIILFIIPILTLCLTATHAQFQYVSPTPGSKMNRIGQHIIIREGSILKAASVNDNLFLIEGSKSGRHEFKITLCRDNKTIILHPARDFSYNETVTVSIRKGLQSLNGKQPEGYSFSFTTHRKYTEEEITFFKSAKQQAWQEELAKNTESRPEPEEDADTRDISNLYTITINNNPAPGDIFFDAFSAFFFPNSWTGYYAITSEGDSVYGKALNNVSDFKMLDNGNFGVRNGNEDRYEELDSNFNKVRNIYAANGYEVDFHELQITPDNYTWIIADENQVVDMTVYNPNYSDHATVTGTLVQQFDPDGNLIFQWRSFDHIEVIEANHVSLSSNYIDYIHTNAIDVDNDGHILVSHRHLDQITKIDVNTGDFIWRMGGQLNEFTFINDDEKFSYQHDIRRIENGNVTLWDNGNYHQPSHSAAKEYQLDEVNKVATLVWSYGHPGTGANDLYYLAGGSAQRLSNGNTFINGGWRSNNQNPSMFEVTPDGTIVWEIKLDPSKSMTCYRAHKYEWNPCARPSFSKLNTKEITATSAKVKWNSVANVVKYKVQYKKHADNTWTLKNAGANKTSFSLTGLDPNTKYDWKIETWCDVNGTKYSGYTDIKKFTTLPLKTALVLNEEIEDIILYPNPAHDLINIASKAPVTEVYVFDLSGREVIRLKPELKADASVTEVNLNSLTPGTYLIEVISDHSRSVKKVVLE